MTPSSLSEARKYAVMKLRFDSTALPDVAADALIVGVTGKEGALSVTGGGLADALAAARADGFAGEEGDLEVLFPVAGLKARRVVLVGLGDEALTAEAWRKAVGTAMNELRGKVRTVAIAAPAGLDAVTGVGAAAEAAVMASYNVHLYHTQKKETEKAFETLVLLVAAGSPEAQAAERGAGLGGLVNEARDLSNKPGNMLTPPMLRDAFLQTAKTHGLKATVLEVDALKEQGFGCLVAVGQGSVFPPCFVALEYNGGKPGDKPFVLVGKGVTYDTGGICIKPRAGMEEMKTDMHGAATVVGALAAAAARKLPVNLVALCPIAENMPSGRAIKPGDLVTAYNGLIVEIIDTDAEGRLILADALAYGAKHYDARATVDVATLTGSIIMALGYEASGLFTPDDDLAAQLSIAGTEIGERVWRFPVWDAYDSGLTSDIADVKNVAKGKGDAIMAAMFLKRFAGDGPWAHLDIAGPSYLSEGKDYRTKGSTGVGIRLLLEWVENQI